MFSNGPSKHLTWDELACHNTDRTEYPLMWRESRAIILAEMFELVRLTCGDKPIKVVSGYRTRIYNRKIGGATHSQHVQGRALDMRPPEGWTIDNFYKLIKDAARYSSIKGVGKYRTFVHMDIRSTNEVAYWFGSGVKDDRQWS